MKRYLIAIALSTGAACGSTDAPLLGDHAQAATAATVTYGYDALGRLTTTTTPTGKTTYGWDAASNRTTVTRSP